MNIRPYSLEDLCGGAYIRLLGVLQKRYGTTRRVFPRLLVYQILHVPPQTKTEVVKVRRSEWQIMWRTTTEPLPRRKMKRRKVKFTLEQATKAQMGSRGIAVLFL